MHHPLRLRYHRQDDSLHLNDNESIKVTNGELK